MKGIVWKVVRTAASNIPWGRLVENTPALLDLVERAKERFRAAGPGLGHGGVEDQLRVIQEENVRLADTLLKTSEQLQELTMTLEVVVARQKMIGTVAVVSLLAAVTSLVLWVVK